MRIWYYIVKERETENLGRVKVKVTLHTNIGHCQITDEWQDWRKMRKAPRGRRHNNKLNYIFADVDVAVSYDENLNLDLHFLSFWHEIKGRCFRYAKWHSYKFIGKGGESNGNGI